ncbi:TraB/GumN family protein [Shewanella inventionis]|uniref:Protein GumN n=1 Tax=Shewanella inventionis TaxID=1738770 RepID=A0ABQ1ILP4_9GAMM|nr:TraB/GumN family protein [Shewanella inventionis]MCL1156544.1 TraB/GumN family protein [Shewanella inventionis]UAL44238.1 TraB/GumN family protein [Shewanella inventionis]GGB46342.1 protein GumN [Shewanella inventionis]
MQATRKSRFNFAINVGYRQLLQSYYTIAFAMLGLVSLPAAALDSPIFYKVEYQQQQAYLLGSIHIGQPNFYPLAQHIESAFKQSDALVVEADISQGDTGAMLQQYGALSPDIAPDVEATRRVYCQTHQAMCQALAPYAPWLQSTQISVSRYAELGYSAEQGVDAYFTANKQDKDLIELESIQFQFELISSFSTATQLQMLDEAINASDAEMLDLIHAWRQGDAKALASIMESQAGDSDEFLAKLLWQRNHSMTHKIMELLQAKTHKNLFIVVGAGHIVGQQAIPDLLRQQGATVTRCTVLQC